MEKDRKYYEFIECLKKEAQNFTKNWRVEVKFCPSGQDRETEDILCVDIPTRRGDGIQRFNIEEMYQDLINGRADMAGIVINILGTCLQASMAGSLYNVEGYKELRKHIILRPLNYGYNKEKLNEGVYYLIGDIALTLYINIGNFKNNYVSCMAPKKLLTIWEKGEVEVMETAIRNTYRMFSPRIFNTFSSLHLGEPQLHEFMHTTPDILKTGQVKSIFITTENIVNGAIAIFVPGVAKRLAELIGNDLYVGFISINEAVIHDSSLFTVDDIREGLKRSMPVITKDYLSRKVYFYCREHNQFEVVG